MLMLFAWTNKKKRTSKLKADYALLYFKLNFMKIR